MRLIKWFFFVVVCGRIKMIMLINQTSLHGTKELFHFLIMISRIILPKSLRRIQIDKEREKHAVLRLKEASIDYNLLPSRHFSDDKKKAALKLHLKEFVSIIHRRASQPATECVIQLHIEPNEISRDMSDAETSG
jgi:hypothetical protein